MIRDPSDGSVKEIKRPMVSALAEPDKKNTDESVRLEKSREWLKKYQLGEFNAISNP